MKSTVDERLCNAILDQATAWFARHRAHETLTAAERMEFMAWVQQSPRHVEEYLALQQLAEDLPAVLAGINVVMGVADVNTRGTRSNVIPIRPEVPESTPRRRRLSPAVRAILALTAALIISLLTYWVADGRLRSHAFFVPHGEQRTAQLPDGSVMHLNANSRAVVRYTGAERLIELQAGQALFEVTHDPKRPFRVRAGNTQVVAVGTQVDVYRRSEAQVTVTVLQGKVDVVSPASLPGTAEPHLVVALAAPLHVSAGEQVEVGLVGIPRVESVDVHLATAWVHREIAFDRRPLGEIAKEINRYAAVPISIEDGPLRELRVSGVLDVYDTDSLVLFLGQYGTVEVGQHAIRIRSRAKPRGPASITAAQ